MKLSEPTQFYLNGHYTFYELLQIIADIWNKNFSMFNIKIEIEEISPSI